MTFFAKSKGLLARSKQVSTCFEQQLKPYKKSLQLNSNQDSVVGWGFKSHTLKLKEQVTDKYKFIHLEDGFIGYIGHPAKNGQNVSLIADKLGMYYQSQQPSDLDVSISNSLTDKQIVRVRKLIEQIQQHGITKYNCYLHIGDNKTYPKSLDKLKGQSFVLLVDQVAGDQSVIGAQATEHDFLLMIDEAKARYPESAIVVRTHPDTQFGKKTGVLANLIASGAITNVEVCNEICHPHSLIRHAKAIFTVSSQMGFEGLILGKKVHCFGLPFYAGWALTIDSKQCCRRSDITNKAPVTLEQLVYAALIDYPRYCNPVSQRRCEIEEIVELLKYQQHPQTQWNTLYLVGFSFWKRSFMAVFCQHLAKKLIFTNKNPYKLAKTLTKNEQMLVWGNKFPTLINVLRVEDGFIRSSGLGSNLCKPSSLCIDSLGMYFNAQRLSQLETSLMGSNLTQEQYLDAVELLTLLKQQKVSKYNLSSVAHYQKPNTQKKILLVVGQVENDASILTGSPVIRSNQELLETVRKENSDSWIIYKPHPDVIAKNRTDDLAMEAITANCDELILDIPLNQLFEHIDELHTMTSLSGFEALIQGVKVVCWGQPFYSGWGLTKDKHPLVRRTKELDLATLIYHTLNYPLYIDWKTGLFISPNQLILIIANQAKRKVSQSKLNRWHLKGQHLFDALMYHLKKV